MRISEKQIHDYICDMLIEQKSYKHQDELPKILPDTDLQSVGMDSMLFIQLIVFLESTYSLEIDDNDLLMEKFSSINKIIKTMKNYCKERNDNDV